MNLDTSSEVKNEKSLARQKIRVASRRQNFEIIHFVGDK